MSSRKPKTQIPAELRVFLAVVGEIVQEHLQSRREQNATITDAGHDKNDRRAAQWSRRQTGCNTEGIHRPGS